MIKKGDLVLSSCDAQHSEKQYWRSLLRMGRRTSKTDLPKKYITMAQGWIVDAKAKLKELGGV